MKCNFCKRDQPQCGAVTTIVEVDTAIAICERCASGISDQMSQMKDDGEINNHSVLSMPTTEKINNEVLELKEGIVSSGTAVILIRGGYVCVGIRGEGCGHGSGRIAFPGGHIDHPDTTLAISGARETHEETGTTVEFLKLAGGHDLLTTLHITNDDGMKRYVTTYLVARYVEGGDWLDDHTLQGKEPDKIKHWKFCNWSELKELVRREKEKMPGEPWWPIDALECRLNIFGLRDEIIGLPFRFNKKS